MNKKRQEQGILFHLTFYFLLLVGVIYGAIMYLYPNVMAIEGKKATSHSLYKEIQETRSKGITFGEFKKQASKGTLTTYTKEIITNLESDFYKEHLGNTTSLDYKGFLESKKKELEDSEDEKNGNTEKVSRILPSYTEAPVDLGSDYLTDFKFINYLESIFETFGLSYSDSIGIKDLVLLEEFASQDEKQQSLETNIFAIPVSVSLEGTKIEIINFLTYIQNIGNISINKDGDILVDTEPVLQKFNRNIVLKGDIGGNDYNIYEHQIIDIESIRMKDYIDSTYKPRDPGVPLKEFLLSTNQGNQEFEIDVKLLFYVKGIPNYKVEEFIKEVLQKYTTLLKDVNNALKDPTLKGYGQLRVKKINSFLKELAPTIKQIRTNLAKKESLDQVYKQVFDLSRHFEEISSSLSKETSEEE